MDLDNPNGHPAMDYEAHKRTYQGFWLGVQIVTVVSVIILILLAITLL